MEDNVWDNIVLVVFLILLKYWIFIEIIKCVKIYFILKMLLLELNWWSILFVKIF